MCFLTSSLSIGTDASNKGNIKMFSLVYRYVSKEAGGIQTKLLSFFNGQQETSGCLLQKQSNDDDELCTIDNDDSLQNLQFRLAKW
jgi:hypothetical protein